MHATYWRGGRLSVAEKRQHIFRIGAVSPQPEESLGEGWGLWRTRVRGKGGCLDG